MNPQIKQHAPAKINLSLNIVGKREDNYHLLESIIVFTQLGDEIIITPSNDLSMTVEGLFADQLDLDDNLVMEAGEKLAELTGVKKGASITLKKNLPIGAGLAGGSADAAATLRGLCTLWDITIDHLSLLEYAALLGSDVPVCLQSIPSYVEGVGEILSPLRHFPSLPILLINPNIMLPTPKVFKRIFPPYKQKEKIHQFPTEKSEWLLWLAEAENDLTSSAIAIVPEIADIMSELLHQQNCITARMSGSGATCFGVFSDKHSADTAEKNIAAAHQNWWVKSTYINGSN